VRPAKNINRFEILENLPILKKTIPINAIIENNIRKIKLQAIIEISLSKFSKISSIVPPRPASAEIWIIPSLTYDFASY